ncbi:KRAB [Mytilus coruscus]|uniref:KRAB n=1 Tax=Mytilus coruscus TaxID=42192 RepID=A0A6J8B0F5_MYTCO|nr:KRAB [Mytilus coruscus]
MITETTQKETPNFVNKDIRHTDDPIFKIFFLFMLLEKVLNLKEHICFIAFQGKTPSSMEGSALQMFKTYPNHGNDLCLICKQLFFAKSVEKICINCEVKSLTSIVQQIHMQTDEYQNEEESLNCKMKKHHRYACVLCKDVSKYIIPGNPPEEKPYNCDISNTAFTQSSSLNTHKQIKHSNQKPYNCNVGKHLQ